jgi:hypothetical protein
LNIPHRSLISAAASMKLDTSSSSDSGAEDQVLKSVLDRKAAQKAKRRQPWKDAYVPKASEQPSTTSPHDKPWIRDGAAGPEFSWGDEGYDTDAGKT